MGTSSVGLNGEGFTSQSQKPLLPDLTIGLGLRAQLWIPPWPMALLGVGPRL